MECVAFGVGVAAVAEGDEEAALAAAFAFAFHDGLECVDVRAANFVDLLYLDREAVCRLQPAGVVGPKLSIAVADGKMRPSTPMSPTCTLFGMPPSAMTAQFSNSNGGNARSFSLLHGKSRTMKASGLTGGVPRLALLQLAGVPQPLSHHPAGGGRNVDPDPLPPDILHCDEHRAAAA